MKRRIAIVAALIGAWLLLAAPVRAQNHPPVADGGPDQSALTDEIVELHGSASDPDGDPIVSWLWAIESQPAGSDPLFAFVDTADPLFSANLVGTYILSLTVSDGVDSSLPDTVTITLTPNQPPVLVFTVEPTSGVAPLLVHCDASQSYDPEGQPIQFVWDFNDGSVDVGAVVDHEYVLDNTYWLELRVIDIRGAVATDTTLIDVLRPNNPPFANPTAAPVTGNAPLVVDFAANAYDWDGDPLTFDWQFGDGIASTEEIASHTYTSAGVFTVWLTVSDGTDETIRSLTIDVSAPPSSFKIEGSTFNAGGHPDEGTILTSSNYRMTLDALGGSAGAGALGSTSWRMEAGLTPGYRPPGEVVNLRFDDATTLRWDAEPSAALYHVYDGDTCVPPALNQTMTTITATPGPGGVFTYLVTAENGLGEEGIRGYRSDGSGRTNPTPCP